MIYEIKPRKSQDEAFPLDYDFRRYEGALSEKEEKGYGSLDQLFSEQGFFRTSRAEMAYAAVLCLHDHQLIHSGLAITMLLCFGGQRRGT